MCAYRPPEYGSLFDLIEVYASKPPAGWEVKLTKAVNKPGVSTRGGDKDGFFHGAISQGQADGACVHAAVRPSCYPFLKSK